MGFPTLEAALSREGLAPVVREAAESTLSGLGTSYGLTPALANGETIVFVAGRGLPSLRRRVVGTSHRLMVVTAVGRVAEFVPWVELAGDPVSGRSQLALELNDTKRQARLQAFIHAVVDRLGPPRLPPAHRERNAGEADLTARRAVLGDRILDRADRDPVSEADRLYHLGRHWQPLVVAIESQGLLWSSATFFRGGWPFRANWFFRRVLAHPLSVAISDVSIELVRGDNMTVVALMECRDVALAHVDAYGTPRTVATMSRGRTLDDLLTIV